MERIILLHGFTGSMRSWRAVVRPVSQLVPTLTCSLPGHEGSSLTTNPEFPVSSFKDTAEELLRFLQPAGDLLVGYSLGARFALALALAAQDSLSGLMLISGNPGLEDEAERGARRVEDENRARLLESEGLEPFIRQWESLPLFAQAELASHTKAEEAAIRRSHTALGLAHSLRSHGLASMPSYWSRLKELQLPVEIVAGQRDDKFCRIAQRMAGLMPHATLSVVAGASHNPTLSHPELIAARILELWSGRRQQGPQSA